MDNEKKIREFLTQKASGDIIEWPAQVEASEIFGRTYHEVEQVALSAGLLPSRYKRNRNTVSISRQALLFKSTVAVVGCGGIGGHLIEQLARLGVGNLVLVDPDTVEDHNVNRQLLSSLDVTGVSKVELAARRVKLVNPATDVCAYDESFSKENAYRILGGADLAIDALDNIGVKRELANACSEINIPLVYGSVAGWYGQVSTQYPGEDTIKRILSRCSEDIGVEIETGNVSFGPAVVAGVQVAEACKIITGQGEPLRERMLFIDLLNMEMEVVLV